LLVKAGRAQEFPAHIGTNAAPRHPRTAVGDNKNFVFLVEVDGRQPELSMGMTFTELANLMEQLGCSEAMNLDGGGSATFWLNGKVVNSPSDKHERAVANALVIVRRPD
jgi:exopolysaccharide biosynthesis protein